MKIICIKNITSQNVEFYIKPDTALFTHKHPFYLPPISKKFTTEMQLIIRVNRVGKSIPEKFASRYYFQMAMGINITAKDANNSFANLFDNSTIPSNFVDINNNTNIGFKLNGQIIEELILGNITDAIDKYIAEISEYITFKIGDILVFNISKKENVIKEGDTLEGYINGEKLLSLNIN